MKHTSYLSLAADILSDFLYKIWHHRRIIRHLEVELMNTFIKKVQKYQEA